MFERFLSEQNPQWFGKLPNTGVRRELLSRIERDFDIDHTVAISGVRRCGKSFLIKQIISRLIDNGVPDNNLLFVNVEQALFSGMNTQEILDKFLSEYRRLRNPQGRIYLFFDEIQTLEKWEIWIKYQYDLNKGKIKFFITGSNSQLMSSEFATHLTGRVIERRLTPFSFREYLDFRGYNPGNTDEWVVNEESILHRFDEYLLHGGMPEALTALYTDTVRTILLGTFDTIIFKDIVPRFNIRQSVTLRKLGLYLIGQCGNITNLNKIGSMLEIDRNKVREFIGFLESSLFVHSLQKFEYSERKQILSQKKTYICDNGFISDLAFQFSPNKGDLLENVVLGELKRRHSYIFYHKNQNECDFIVYEYGRESAVWQVCYELNESNRNREIKGLLSGCRQIGIECGTILTYNQREEFSDKDVRIKVIPVWEWLMKDIDAGVNI